MPYLRFHLQAPFENIFKCKQIWLRALPLLLMFALAVTRLDSLGPTFDEQGFLVRGLGYMRGENQQMRVGHPLGLNALNAALLVHDETVRLPTAHPSWTLTGFHRPAELFLWEIGNDVARTMLLARLPTIWLGLLLAALVGRWTWQVTRQHWAALLALYLVTFDPNILAHTRLVTTDLGLTFFAFLAGYALWWFWQRPSWHHALLAGITFGLLQNSKFTAGLFVPLFALIILINFGVQIWGLGLRPSLIGIRQSPIIHLFMLVVAYLFIAPLTLWAVYGFQIGTLPQDLPTLPQLGGLTLPLSHHLEQLLDIGGRMQKSTPAFLMGNYSDRGWWYYFPVAFWLKTPLPTLLLLLGGGFSLLWLALKCQLAGRWLSLAALLIPALGYFAFALTTEINLGYRHILPTLPFLIVFTAVSLANLWKKSPALPNWFRFGLLGLSGWLVASTLWLSPHYLAFFNELAGGPDGGWRYLVDSNLDWGQDLGNLKTWLDENGVDQIWLSYFGEGRPEYYGIQYTGLDSWPPRLMNPSARPFYPHDPAPGIYAISATNLQGVQFADHDQFDWFRDKEPLAKIGYSIFIYDVPAYGEPVDLVLSGVQLDEIAPDDFARLETNDITPHWVDLTGAFLWPEKSPYWLVVSRDEVVHFFFSEWIVNEENVSETEEYLLYRVDFEYVEQENLQTFLQDDHQIDLVDFSIPDGSLNQPLLMVITRWQNQSPPVPIKLFIHLTDSEGNIQAQWDGLSTLWEGFRQGDMLIQIQQFEIPNNLPPGSYQVRAGIYHPDTGKRWQTESGDWVLLDELVVEE